MAKLLREFQETEPRPVQMQKCEVFNWVHVMLTHSHDEPVDVYAGDELVDLKFMMLCCTFFPGERGMRFSHAITSPTYLFAIKRDSNEQVEMSIDLEVIATSMY